MPARRSWIALRRTIRRIVHHTDPKERIARGVAAGFFATAFPLPGLQIPLSLLCAFAVNGNRFVSIFPQFLSNTLTVLPIAYLEFRIGAWFRPGTSGDLDGVYAALARALGQWNWTAPFDSIGNCVQALGIELLAPLFLGVLLLGVALAVLSYPLTILSVFMWRRRRFLRNGKSYGHLPFLLEAPPATTALEAKARYALHKIPFERAEKLQLLVNGREAFPEMLRAIDGARSSVDLESYILRFDKTGERFKLALCAAAQRGAQVRVIYDFIGSLGLPQAYIDALRAAGVSVAVYHPFRGWRRIWSLNRRTHRKILVVDGQVAFTGGLNIADDYAAVEDGGKGWRDTHLRVDGPAPALALAHLFQFTWRRAHKFPPDPKAQEPKPPHRWMPTQVLEHVRENRESKRQARLQAEKDARLPPALEVQVLGNREFRKRHLIRLAYLHAINRARHSILIENAYFIPDRGVQRALARAVKRGVEVAVCVARNSDVELAAQAGRALYADILHKGVRLFEWPEGMLHAKTAVIDGAWSIVGSYNFNQRSLLHDLEAVVVTCDPAFSRRLFEQTQADIARCTELRPEVHDVRALTQILLQTFCFQFRHWL